MKDLYVLKIYNNDEKIKEVELNTLQDLTIYSDEFEGYYYDLTHIESGNEEEGVLDDLSGDSFR